MRASDKKRLREMEKEFVDCYLNRYYADPREFYKQNPDAGSLRDELAEQVRSQKEQVRLPTYFLYWEDEEIRRRMWILMHDPIARALVEKLLKVEKDIIDGKSRMRRMKRVGDGSHTPVEDQSGESAQAETPYQLS